MTHVVTGLELGEDDETATEHPILQRHPTSGRTALYMSTPSRCVAISDMSDEDAQRTVADLFAHSTREENIHRHAWSPDDIVVWDNRCVMHRADHSGVVGDRHASRNGRG